MTEDVTLSDDRLAHLRTMATGAVRDYYQVELAAAVLPLLDEVARLRGLSSGLAERVAAQAKLPEKRAEAPSPAADVNLAVVADVRRRSAVGLAKYGKPVAAADASEDWLRHAYEECLDMAVYLKAELLRRAESLPGHDPELGENGAG